MNSQFLLPVTGLSGSFLTMGLSAPATENFSELQGGAAVAFIGFLIWLIKVMIRRDEEKTKLFLQEIEKKDKLFAEESKENRKKLEELMQEQIKNLKEINRQPAEVFEKVLEELKSRRE